MDRIKRGSIAAGVMVYALMSSSSAYAVAPSSLSQVPLFLVTSAEAQVMLNMSNDHQLFYKAYDDWSDVDSDGAIDITYDHSIDYYGYFDSYKCYDYDSGSRRFEPQGISANKYCNSVSGSWSGNFLNWSTMSRIDTVRKILFGGLRSTDTSSLTVLERSYLPGDAHSFAKYYGGGASEIGKLTPFNAAEITLCNTTYAANGDSEDRTEPPLIRVADGNFALWAANERHQCHWDNHSELQGDIFNSPNPNTNNGNHPATTGLNADADNPSWTSDKLGLGDYVVRVEACKSGLIGQEKCKVYPNGNSKPVGLLQEYGDDGQIHFGLITGSFRYNKSGGTLRKNVGSMTDEVNVTTDGTFKTPPAAGNIIGALSALRVSGYDHDPGYYNSADSCSWGRNSFNNGECTNWGNPQSEIFLESLRYFAGKTPNFNANDSSYINGLVTASSWTDPLSSANYCAPLNIIQFNASVTSYDRDNLGGVSDLAGLSSLNTWTDKVGTGESIAGGSFFLGEGTGTTSTDGICTAKTISNLSDAEGICPEAPRLEGGYDIAGLAHYARTTSIRADISDNDGNTADIMIKTYGVTLSPAVPKIEVPVPGSTGGVVTILPACRNQSISGNCAIVDFKVVQPNTQTSPGVYEGKFYVNWEDSEQGGDFDQDMAGVLSYVATASQIKVTTAAFADSTPNEMAFGYIIGGTTQDGFHAHSGINYFTAYTDPTGALTCRDASIDCETGEPATSVTYTIGVSPANLLNDPLWYAAKWGGFEEDDLTVAQGGSRPNGTAAPNDVPDQTYEWDKDGDGIPDSYFYSTNPAELETSLEAVFLDVSRSLASASSTAANSQRISTDTTIYQARFSSANWTGELLAYPVIPSTGFLSSTPAWDAGAKLQNVAWNAREIITNVPGTGGAPFEWSSLNATQQGWLDINPDTLSADSRGQDRVEYLRGNDAEEVQNNGIFRDRIRKLGDLINSAPAYVGEPNFGYPNWVQRNEDASNPATVTNATAESYGDFMARIQALRSGSGREPMLYVGGNDGMLHAFAADPSPSIGGSERLAFVPNSVMSDLNQLTSPSYSHRYYVDGTPTAGDVMFADNQWHTMLAGGLNGGGRGIFALDITDPSGFSEGNAANLVLWEVDPTVTGFGDLGYTYSRPAVVKNHSGGNAKSYEAGEGNWIVVFGNGYASASGSAVLYVADAETGVLIDSVVVDSSGNNGLSTVSPVDIDGDYKIDVIYAGDLKGNLWKFIPDGTLTGWKADFNGAPLFTAPSDPSSTVTNVQPITMRIEVGRHPTGLPGVVVYFGTGSYFQVGDNVGNADTQSVYGIWDVWDKCFGNTGGRLSRCGSTYSKVVGATTYTPPTTPSITRNNLLKQCVTGTDGVTCLSKRTAAGQPDATTGSVNAYDVRIVSQNQITTWDWSSSRGDMGWYLDLPDFGEKQVTRHILRGGRLIFVSIIPSDHACEDGGESWLMELDAANGGRFDIPVFDLNGDGVFDANDNFGGSAASNGIPVSGKKSQEGITQPPSIVASGDLTKEFKYASGSKGGVEVTTESPSGETLGRKSWVRLQ